ncbi:MAG: ASKHA domain-containing protein [Gemmatimonadota bacterium]
MAFVVRFLPEARSWHGDEPTPLAVAAAGCGLLVEQPCGAKAVCGRCRVRSVDGALPATAEDRRLLGDEVDDGWRLACRAVLAADAVVEVPPATRAVAHKTFGDDGLFRGGFERALATGRWGIALDVGSTTVAAALVDLDSGAVQASASTLNPQVHYGGDVVSRIAFARRRQDGGAELHRVLALALDALIGECLAAGDVAPGDLAGVAAVGNPTMTHTLLGLDVGGLGVAPFEGVRYDAWHGPLSAAGLTATGAQVELYVGPAVQSHVGADAVAAALAAGLDRTDRPRLLVDLGTNSEVMLAWHDGVLCTSASAGPAFEGATLHHGMRAVPGAVDRVRIDADGSIRTTTIGAEPPVGICGSGLVDAVAELLRAGVLEPAGRMRPREELGWLSPRLAGRVEESAEPGRFLRLAGDEHHPVLLTAHDVRELQLVKGSIAAAVRLLLAEAGLGLDELEEVLVAGAFGNFVHPASARAIGLVPSVPPRRLRFVGNAAGAGARMLLVDRRARDRADALAARARFVELGNRPDYQDAFVEALPFPQPGESR